MQKEAVAEALKKMAAALRSLAQERDALLVKSAQLESELKKLETEKRVEKLAELMGQKGPYAGTSMNQRISVIRSKLASGTSLDELERALNIIAPDGSLGKLGSAAAGGDHGSLEMALKQWMY